MRNHGFSLIELMLVIAVIAILGSIATLSWQSMQKKAAIETQAKTMYGDLMDVRSQALYTKRARSVAISSGLFQVYSSTVTSVPPVSQKTLGYAVVWSSAGTITFDTAGLANGSERSLCVDPYNDLTVVNAAAVDSLVISAARINLGKRTGGNCVTNNIEQK
ncbi:pilus assembly FimT family protein [Geobacter argillaceus]|uniref:Type IV fimbrial biogenesis protein FimT n=1 Tax=Geobacter argillaceus TaxID=345631 RepID=A0A562WRL6_9BACT|nr:prepilin-type N-terminal cleavage/methylation domain-containing protein [Geobacter argillaceus]TWJ32786.1 type IV fimbrial biogenesis protein FimT [Geobacter argillaceus]